jgi:hypothetical protein
MQWQTTPLVYNSTDATFDGTTSKFTVNTTGAYWVNIQLSMPNATTCYPMLEINDAGWTGSVLGSSVSVTTSAAPTGYTGKGYLNSVLYLSANDYFKIRLSSSSNLQGCTTTTGSSWMAVTKLN